MEKKAPAAKQPPKPGPAPSKLTPTARAASHDKQPPPGAPARAEGPGSSISYLPLQQSVLAKRSLPQTAPPSAAQDPDYRTYRATLERTAAQPSYYGMQPESTLPPSERSVHQRQLYLAQMPHQHQHPQQSGARMMYPANSAFAQAAGYAHPMGTPVMQPVMPSHHQRPLPTTAFAAMPAYANKDTYQALLLNRALETAQKNTAGNNHYSMPFPQQEYMSPLTQDAMQLSGRVVHPTVFANARDLEMMRGGSMTGFPQRANAGGVSYHVAGGASDRDMSSYMPSANMFHTMSGPNAHASLGNVDEGTHGGSGFGSPFLNKLPNPSSSSSGAGPLDPAVAMRSAPQTYMSSLSRASGFGNLPQQSASLYQQHLQQPLRPQRRGEFGVDPDMQL